MPPQQLMPLPLVFRRTFLGAFVVSLLYFSLSHWRVFEANSWNIPGFFILAAAVPWSSLWSSHMRELGQVFGWEMRNVATVGIIPLGFSVNCAVVVTAVLWLIRKTVRTSDAQRSEENAS